MKKKLMQKNFTINNFGIKKSIVSEWILKAFRDARNRMQRGVFYYKAQKNKKKPKQNKLTQAVAGTSRQHQCPSSCVVPGEKANAATVSQHAVSTRCSTG